MSRSRRGTRPWLVLAALVLAALAVLLVRDGGDDSDGARARRIAASIKCPVCQGLSVADSNDQSSRTIRDDIRDRIDAGQSDDAIRDAYVARYGEQVLLEPERDGLGLVVWLVPLAVLVAGGAGVVLAVRRWRSAEAATAPADVAPEPADGAEAKAGSARGVAVTVVLVAVAAVAIGVLSASSAGDGDDSAADGPVATLSPAAQLDALAEAVADRPDDYDARIAYARALLGADPAEALRQYREANRIDPDQPEPPAYIGWISTLTAQQVDDAATRAELGANALEWFDRALAIDGDYADAYVFKGLLQLRVLGDAAGAVPTFQRWLTLAPEDHPQREMVLAALGEAVEASGASPTVATVPTTVPGSTPE